MAADVSSYQSAATTPTLPESTDLTSAFTLKGVRQVKGGITVIDAIELAIPHSAIIALVGPSGAGKTSLLRLLNRLDDFSDWRRGATAAPAPPGPSVSVASCSGSWVDGLDETCLVKSEN